MASGSWSKSIQVSLSTDEDVNAASIGFASGGGNAGATTYPIETSAGDVLATVTFSKSGELLQIELLDASNQLPGSLRQ